MIQPIPGLPDHVLAFSASGKVTGTDYQQVIVPAVEKALAQSRKVRFLYYLGADFTGFEAAAAWADTKIGLEHPAAWERIALVTDVEWLRVAAQAFGFVMPGHVRVFANAELDAAKRWISE